MDVQTDAATEAEPTTTPQPICDRASYSKFYEFGPCEGSCGTGKRTRTRNPLRNMNCEPIVEEEDCYLHPCVNKGKHTH